MQSTFSQNNRIGVAVSGQQALQPSVAKSGAVPSIQSYHESQRKKSPNPRQNEERPHSRENATETDQWRQMRTPFNQNEKVKQIHNQLNSNAEAYQKMYDIIQREQQKHKEKMSRHVGAQVTNTELQLLHDVDGENSEDDLFDPNVLMKLKFQQSAERKSWQGVNVLYSGIPGTSSLIPYERTLMFQEERDEVEAQNKITDIFRDIYDIFQAKLGSVSNASNQGKGQGFSGSGIQNSRQIINTKYSQSFDQHLGQNVPRRTQNQDQGDVNWINQNVYNNSDQRQNEASHTNFIISQSQSLSNDYFIKFKVFEMMQSKNGGVVDINKQLIKRIQSISNQQTYFSMQGTASHQAINQSSLCFYKMLKCESKLIRFILELNGLMSTDRHDWNMLWTHTQGKTYFYERLNPTQKINHFPLSQELTRKDRLAVNIKKMQQRYSKTYFNFIPETFILPEQLEQFEEQFLHYQDKIRKSGGNYGSIQRATKGNMWIVKPTSSSQGKGIFILDKLQYVPKHEACVISRYIDNPLLLFGHKFDLRIYVVVTCYDPLRIYVYREGLVRFATEKYQSNIDGKQEDGSVFAHLTNYSINKKNENYVQNSDAQDDDSGFKWSFSAMQQHFKDNGIDVNLMWSKIYDVIIKSLVSIEEQTKNQIKKSNIGRNNCYELFGYDILLDNYMNPWLLEINLSPSLAFDSPLDLKIKANLIKDTFNLIGLVKPECRNSYTNSQNQNQAKSFSKEMNAQNKQIQNEIYDQIKNLNDINWIQKEYLNQFLQLSTRHKEIIVETILENQRRGNFVRIYPTKNSDFYDCFLSQNKSNQQVVYQFLYSEVFFSFKDVSKTKNIFMLKNEGKQQDQRHLSNQADNGHKIARELLYEYLQRLTKQLKESKILALLETEEMQELLKKQKKLLKEECLQVNDDCIDDNSKSSQQSHSALISTQEAFSPQAFDDDENQDDDSIMKGIKRQLDSNKTTLVDKTCNFEDEFDQREENTIDLTQDFERNKKEAKRKIKIVTIDEIVQRIQHKCKEIQQYTRKMAEIELRRQMVKNAGGYSQIAMRDITVPETKIKAYLNSSSQKILQQCQQSYLIKQIERHACYGAYKMDKQLFYINGRLILDFLYFLKSGKKPSSINLSLSNSQTRKGSQMFDPGNASNLLEQKRLYQNRMNKHFNYSNKRHFEKPAGKQGDGLSTLVGSRTSNKQPVRYHSHSHPSNQNLHEDKDGQGGINSSTKHHLDKIDKAQSKRQHIQQQLDQQRSNQQQFQETLHKNKRLAAQVSNRHGDKHKLHADQSTDHDLRSLQQHSQQIPDINNLGKTQILNNKGQKLYETVGKTIQSKQPKQRSPNRSGLGERDRSERGGDKLSPTGLNSKSPYLCYPQFAQTDKDRQYLREAKEIAFSGGLSISLNTTQHDMKSQHKSSSNAPPSLPMPAPHPYKKQKTIGIGMQPMTLPLSHATSTHQEVSSNSFKQRMTFFDSRQPVVASKPNQTTTNASVSMAYNDTRSVHLPLGISVDDEACINNGLGTPMMSGQKTSKSGKNTEITNRLKNLDQDKDQFYYAQSVSKSVVGGLGGKKSDAKRNKQSIKLTDPDAELIKKESQALLSQSFSKPSSRNKFVKVQDYGISNSNTQALGSDASIIVQPGSTACGSAAASATEVHHQSTSKNISRSKKRIKNSNKSSTSAANQSNFRTSNQKQCSINDPASYYNLPVPSFRHKEFDTNPSRVSIKQSHNMIKECYGGRSTVGMLSDINTGGETRFPKRLSNNNLSQKNSSNQTSKRSQVSNKILTKDDILPLPNIIK